MRGAALAEAGMAPMPPGGGMGGGIQEEILARFKEIKNLVMQDPSRETKLAVEAGFMDLMQTIQGGGPAQAPAPMPGGPQGPMPAAPQGQPM